MLCMLKSVHFPHTVENKKEKKERRKLLCQLVFKTVHWLLLQYKTTHDKPLSKISRTVNATESNEERKLILQSSMGLENSNGGTKCICIYIISVAPIGNNHDCSELCLWLPPQKTEMKRLHRRKLKKLPAQSLCNGTSETTGSVHQMDIIIKGSRAG